VVVKKGRQSRYRIKKKKIGELELSPDGYPTDAGP
jgi:hypothetical protein